MGENTSRADSIFGRIASSQRIAPYIFIAPFFLFFATFMIWPIFRSLYMSFFDFKGIENSIYVGLENYKLLFKNERFARALLNTTYFAVGMIVFTLLISFTLSLILSSKMIPGRNAYRLVFFLPILTSIIVAGAIFKLIFLDTEAGLLNFVISLGGIPSQRWLLDEFWAINCVLIMAFWRRMGLNAMYFVAGLQSLPPDLYESAVIDGASSWQQLRYITIPMMRPIISFVIIITLIYAYLAFDEVFVLSPAGAMDSVQNNMVTLGYYLYESAFQFFKFGYGSAVGFVITIIIFGISVFQLKILGVFRNE
ncbi:MAG: sugar ABC transporter permease [Spirochaetaceae bacterium]|nr:MAG: sugar ABC transporter permease [Spirochaetaceae bacterium]